MSSIANAQLVIARAGLKAAPTQRNAVARSSSFAAGGRVKSAAIGRVAARAVVRVVAADKPKTVVDIAVSSPDFSILVEAVTKAGLAGALSGPGPFTVFAPTNAAFVKACGALGVSKAQLLALPNLADILKYHVVSGKVKSTDLSNGLQAATLQGAKVKFDLSSGVKVSGAAVTAADIEAENGVVHVIDTVLLPPVSAEAYVKSQAGVSLPFGFFDPLGMLADKTVTEIKRYQESEIVHSRVAMLAVVGYFVGEVANPLFGGSITGPAINQFQQVPQPFWEIVIALIGIAETYRAAVGWVSPVDGLFQIRDSYTPGALGFDPLGLKPTTAAELKDMATKELNNGRLAMMAIVGLTIQELQAQALGIPVKILENAPFVN